MQIQTVRPKTESTYPPKWLCRRARVSTSVAGVIAELAFANRVAHLGDRGESLAAALQECGR